MNHPKPEEWVPFIYGETTGQTRRTLQSHLESCAQCRRETDAWRQSMNLLDSWKVPRAKRPHALVAIPWFGWATATAVVLLCGVFLGRATAPKVDAEKLRTALAPEIRKELSAELAQLVRDETARTASLTLASSRRYTDQIAQQLYFAVKKDVDTLAVNADASLRNTAQQLVQLADYHPEQNPSEPNQ